MFETKSNGQVAKAKNRRTHYSPPFGYFGSKNLIAKRIAHSLPPHNAWVELFCGSAAVTLAKESVPIEVVNDIDEQIVNLFRQLRDNSEDLCRLVALTPYSRRELELTRSSTGNTKRRLELARRFLVSSMMAVNGVFGSKIGGFSYSQSYAREGKDARVNRWYNLPERLHKVVERLRHVRIENKNAIDLLKMFSDKPATLVYLDPPYLMERRQNCYSHDANDRSFHMKLLKEANKARCMVLISGYDNELYSSLLPAAKGWRKSTIKTYTIDTNGERFHRKEVLWKNRFYLLAEKTKQVPIKLTRAEINDGKINPSRRTSAKPVRKP